ncbi:MAG: response regulator transcription factor, partial [Proteobacteria bacterium]|nr:response regulator transcription factor [Pseudomonadota bacterium]
NLSEGTVKNYMTDIFRVLSVTNRTQAARYNPDTA